MSGKIIDYLGRGLASARPASPAISAGGMAFYIATDTGAISAWNGTAWATVGGGGGGGGGVNGPYGSIETPYTPQNFSNDNVVAQACWVPPGGTISKIKFYSYSTAGTRWKVGVYASNAALTMDTLITQQTTPTVGVTANTMHEGTLATPYTNSGTDTVLVFIAVITDTASFDLGKNAGLSLTRYFAASGLVFPSPAPTQSFAGIGWWLQGF